MMGDQQVEIESRDFWFMVVDMLQQNWALVDADPATSQCIVFFVHDLGGVFDRLPFAGVEEAQVALRRNGFRLWRDDAEAQSFLRPPEPPFFEAEHPNGPIYSSGRFWS